MSKSEFKPLHEGLKELKIQESKPKIFKKNPKERIPPDAVRELVAMKGRVATTQAIGCSTSFLSESLSSGEISVAYELAARYVLAQEKEQNPGLSRDQCLMGLWVHYSAITAIQMTPEDSAILHAPLSETLANFKIKFGEDT